MTSSCRRTHIDAFLSREALKISGRVLDIGGKKINQRGGFRPPLDSCWEYLNLDSSTAPDYCVDAEHTELLDEIYDVFLLIETLEHVRNPDKVLAEAYRILKPNGTGLITMPFLYGAHADPYDFQRWTAEKMRLELQRAGFADIHVEPMGGPFSVVFDVFWTMAWRAERPFVRRLLSMSLLPLKPLALFADKLVLNMSLYLTTGWAVKMRKVIASDTIKNK